MELKRAKCAARTSSCSGPVLISWAPGVLQHRSSSKNKKPLAAAEAPAALLCFLPHQCFLDNCGSNDTQQRFVCRSSCLAKWLQWLFLDHVKTSEPHAFQVVSQGPVSGCLQATPYFWVKLMHSALIAGFPWGGRSSVGMGKEQQYIPAGPRGWDSQDLGGVTRCTYVCTPPCSFWQRNQSGYRKCLLIWVSWREKAGLQFQAQAYSMSRKLVRAGLSTALADMQDPSFPWLWAGSLKHR